MKGLFRLTGGWGWVVQGWMLSVGTMLVLCSCVPINNEGVVQKSDGGGLKGVSDQSAKSRNECNPVTAINALYLENDEFSDYLDMC